MDELLDILDQDGNASNATAMKSEAHEKGLFHATVHVWCFTCDARVLIQQRGKDKDTHPLLWDVSVAGHVGAGEEIEAAALRELEEEIGLKVSRADLQPIGIFKSVHEHSETFIDCEFNHTYLCELKIPLEMLRKQESEVEQLALISLNKFSEETWGMANIKKYVPHGSNYYATIIKEIEKRL
ncbi:MAG: NUDIX domain-containing protein [Flavobacteriaceae bacterium]